jgi:hypothetical protein
MIPSGSIVTYTGRWPKPGISQLLGYTAQALTGLVTKDLPTSGLIVRDSKYEANSFFSGSFTVQLILQVENGVGFDSPDDIISIVRHYVFQELYDYPLSDSVPTVQAPGASAPTSTGQPAGQMDAGDTPSGDCSGISGFFSCLAQKSVLYLGVLGIGVGLAVILIVNQGGSISGKGRRK